MQAAQIVGERAAAAEQGIEVDIEAHGVGAMERHLDGTDVVLLGPQVGYQKNTLAPQCEKRNIPLEVIPMQDYGMCNGKNVLALALKLAGK